jgi:hypothetical protein
MVLAAVLAIAALSLLEPYLPLDRSGPERALLAPLVARILVGLAGACVYLLFDLVFFRKRGRCPDCRAKITQGYVDFGKKTIRCEACGHEAPIVEVFGREETAWLTEALLRDPNATEDYKETVTQFRDELLGPAAPLPGLDLGRSRKVLRGICALVCAIGGTAIGGIVAGWAGVILGALVGVAFGLILTGLFFPTYRGDTQ